MAKKLGKFNGHTPRLITDDEGVMTLSINVDPEYRFVMQSVIQQARQLSKDGKGKLVVTVQEYRNTRSLRQNAMMWKLLDVMANHMNGGRPGSVTAEDCYMDMLEQYEAKIDYFECLPEAVDSLRSIFRIVKVVEQRESNGKETVMCKCFHGSCKYDTQEMTMLIEGILDRLADLGVDSSEEAYWREEFYSSQGA